ncbi:hypothetical protein [Pseudosulfitobacter sp. SM2401]|uniref:hypothetical protein n=1 Tax=Pseudosulfitobacter sp. SM2401 TaxID=3350098 RepID=UPI0036F44633
MKHRIELQISAHFGTAPWLALGKQIARHILCRRHSAGKTAVSYRRHDTAGRIVGPYANRLNHWAMLYEVTDGGRIWAGQIFRLGDIQNAVDIAAA